MYVDPAGFRAFVAGNLFSGRGGRRSIGFARFYGLFFGSVILAAVAGFALSLTGLSRRVRPFGSGAAANAILMVFYLFNRGAPIMLFPIPIQIPVKWIVLFTGGIETAYLLLHHFDLFDFVLLLGWALDISGIRCS